MSHSGALLARIWRTPILGEISMAVMNKPTFTQELRRGSRALSQAHVDQTWAPVTPRVKREVLQLYRAANPEKFQGWEADFHALTKRKPTLVIWGDKDPYISRRLAERFNATKVVHLPVEHWAAVEAPAECADTILQFFADNPG